MILNGTNITDLAGTEKSETNDALALSQLDHKTPP